MSEISEYISSFIYIRQGMRPRMNIPSGTEPILKVFRVKLVILLPLFWRQTKACSIFNFARVSRGCTWLS